MRATPATRCGPVARDPRRPPGRARSHRRWTDRRGLVSGTPTGTYTDSLGHTVKLLQYHGTTPSGAADQTTYTYDARGNRSSITSPSGTIWTYGYDTQGRETSATDPDTGTTTTGYDAAGRVTEVDSPTSDLWYVYDNLDRKTAEYANPTIASPRSATNPATGAEQASWTYDTLDKGQQTSSSRYVGSTAGTPGSAFTTTVAGYNTLDEPTGSTLVIPTSSLTGALAGSYTTSYGYASDGTQNTTTDPAEGGLASERVVNTFDNYGQLSEVVGTQLYYGSLEWTGIGQVASAIAGSSAMSDRTNFFYQDGSGRLTEAQSVLTASGSSSSTVAASDVYGYDNAGDETSDTNTTAASTDQQCFGYDYDQRLTNAWTPSSGSCSTAPSSSNLGGPEPYWTSYTYDADSDRASSTEHSTTSGGSDTVDSYSYPAGPGVAQPHGVQTVTHTTGTTTTGTDTYGYNASGQNTSGPGHTYTYDAEGRLATDTTTAGTETRVYNPDGGLLLQSGPGGIKLWNGDTELTATSAGVAGVRTYTALGKEIAERTTTAGVSGTNLYEVNTDPNGSITQTVASTAAMTVANRYLDPFGNTRGSTGSVVDDKSFLGDATDSSNALIAIGQRTYDPVLGRFLTVDPEMEADSPQQLNGYAYAADNPVSTPDPSGLMIAGLSGSDRDQVDQTSQKTGNYGPIDQASGLPINPATSGPVGDYSGSTPHGSGGHIWANTYTPPPPPAVHHKSSGFGFHSLVSGVKAIGRVATTTTDAVTSVGAGIVNTSVSMVTGGAVNLNLQPCLSAADASVCRYGRDVGDGATFIAVQFVPGADEVADGELAAEGAEGLEAGGEALEGAEEEGAADSCSLQSFTPETPVLMASGKPVQLAMVKVGQKVLATDPKTGKTAARPVTKVWVDHDTDLMDVTVRSGGTTTVIHSTQHHPFWDTRTRQWTEADVLTVGDGLLTSSGGTATVAATKVVPGTAYMWDLTVATDHDFYVGPGTGVLVHNCPIDDLAASGREPDPADSGGNLSRAGRAFAKAKEVFGPTSGGPSTINEAGQNALEDVLTTPGVRQTVVQAGKFVGGSRFVTPSGIGAVFDSGGTIQYFGMMSP